MAREIPLTRGKVAIVDDEDYDTLKKWKWYCTGDGYARRHEYDAATKKRRSYAMHRQMMQTPQGMETDHINGNKLDNRRCNLRICTTEQNQWNVGLKVDNTSGFKGVFWRKDRKKWQAMINKRGRRVHLGYFEAPEQAHAAYCNAAKEARGEFARLG